MTTTFFTLAEYAQQSIQRALGSYKSRSTPPHTGTPESANTSLPPAADTESSLPLNQIDLLLPKVCEALVLVTQCLVSLALFSEEECNSKGPVPSQERTPSSPSINFKDYVNSAVSTSGTGSVESIVGSCCVLLVPAVRSHLTERCSSPQKHSAYWISSFLESHLGRSHPHPCMSASRMFHLPTIAQETRIVHSIHKLQTRKDSLISSETL